MIWKIFFVITALFMAVVCALGYNLEYTVVSYLDSIASILCQIGVAIMLGLFYSLGWEKQLFSIKARKISILIFIISMVIFAIASALPAYSESYAQTQSSIIAIISAIAGFLVLIVILNILSIPFYIGLYKYKKNFEKLISTDKPYWKLLAICYTVAVAGFFIGLLTKITHFTSYSLIDYIVIISEIYDVIFMIGFAWNIRVFNKLFWQITAIPYILLALVSPFIISDTFNQDFHIKDTMLSDPISVLFVMLLNFIAFYIVWQYAYSKREITNL